MTPITMSLVIVNCEMPKMSTSVKSTPAQNKALVLKAFNTLFNERNYEAAIGFWSENYFQHSAHIPPGRDGLFGLVRSLPPNARFESGPIVAEDDYVFVHSRFSNIGAPTALITVDIVRIENGKLVEHWDVWQDEATRASSKSGLPMFGDRFPA